MSSITIGSYSKALPGPIPLPSQQKTPVSLNQFPEYLPKVISSTDAPINSTRNVTPSTSPISAKVTAKAFGQNEVETRDIPSKILSIKGSKAKRLLKGKAPGTYIMRHSSTKEGLIIVEIVKHTGRVASIPFEKEGDRYKFICERKNGENLEIVAYYFDNEEQIQKFMENEGKKIASLSRMKVDPFNARELWESLQDETGKMQFHTLDLSSVNCFADGLSCPSETAVQVQVRKETRGYLHANCLGEGISEKSFIASQYPYTRVAKSHAANPADLLWQLALKERLTFLDLTTDKDKWNYQLTPYYPTRQREIVSFGNLQIQLIDNEKNELGLEKNIYQITDLRTGYTKEVTRYHYTQWIDGTAVDVSTLAKLVDLVDQFENTPYVHCLAGIGRTGTLVSACILKEKIKNGEINRENLGKELVNLVAMLRAQRGSTFVQTSKQFALLMEYGQQLLDQKK